MTYYKFKCPHCGKTVGRASSLDVNTYGCPLRTCPNCGKIYIDSHCKEPALYSYKEGGIVSCIVHSIIVALFGAMAVFIVCGIVTAVTDSFYKAIEPIVWIMLGAFIAFFAVNLVYEVKHLKTSNEDALRAWKESDARLRNIEYARLLKDAGFKVPKTYL